MIKSHQNTYVIGIDLGTHGPKVGIFSDRGETLGWEFEPTPYYLTPNGGAEQIPDEWWDAIKKATRRLLEKNLVPVEEITAIGPSTQWCGTVAVDRGGQPLMNAITWMDSRGAPHSQKVMAGFPSLQGYSMPKFLQFLYYNGGCPGLGGKDTIGHMLYIQQELPEIFKQTYKFLEVKDYINLRLTGKMAASFDSINQSAVTDNRDLAHVDYNPRLLKLTGIPRDKLPDLQRSIDILGTLSPQAASELGLSPHTRVALGSPDLPATGIGSGAVLDYTAHLYLGTSSWISCHVPFKKTDLNNYVASFPSPIPDRYFVANEQDWAAGCLDWLLDNIVYNQDEFSCLPPSDDAYQRLNQVASRIPPGSDKVVFTPWLYGERTPIDDAYVRGSFFNISAKTNRAHLTRAVMEGVAYNGRWLLQAVEKFCGRRLDPIRAVGGGAVSETWLQIFADVFDHTIHQVKDPRLATVRGAAFIALVAIGCIAYPDIPGLIQINQSFQPDASRRKIYDELFREFTTYYQNNRKAFTRLNRNGGGNG